MISNIDHMYEDAAFVECFCYFTLSHLSKYKKGELLKSIISIGPDMR